MRQIVFDLETTGFKFSQGHRIVEIGAVELSNGALTGQNFHAYVNPERDMPEDAYRVHGISAAFLADKPRFADSEVAPAFCKFLGDAELIAHNGIAFDLPFLQAELKAAGLSQLENEMVDTLHLARRKYPGASASLDALCARFGVDTKERERDGHGALLDSRLLAEVYIELTGGVQGGLMLDPSEVGDLAEGASRRGIARIAKQRPTPLPSRLTESERKAHSAFLDQLGETALWRMTES